MKSAVTEISLDICVISVFNASTNSKARTLAPHVHKVWMYKYSGTLRQNLDLKIYWIRQYGSLSCGDLEGCQEVRTPPPPPKKKKKKNITKLKDFIAILVPPEKLQNYQASINVGLLIVVLPPLINEIFFFFFFYLNVKIGPH